jgi:hypothetical protein
MPSQGVARQAAASEPAKAGKGKTAASKAQFAVELQERREMEY